MAWSDLAERTLKTAIGIFKTPGTYTRAADQAHPISLDGVFDKAHQTIDPNTGAKVDSTRPTFGICLSDLPAAPDQGDQVTVRGVTYRVIEVMEDGQDGATLILDRTA